MKADAVAAGGAAANENDAARADLKLIAGFVKPGSTVIDVGCGDGSLLALLAAQRGVRGCGIELSQAGVNECVARGLSVVQGDADRDLREYPDDAFDYAILSHTLQATRNPREVVEQLLRIGRRAIVTFQNYGHWRIRGHLLLTGRTPGFDRGTAWYETPSIHYCTIRDFRALCREMGVGIEASHAFGTGAASGLGRLRPFENLFGEQALFMLARG